jgi:acyl-CoA synthetase (AMP-forming)/AMP-acid ligase II
MSICMLLEMAADGFPDRVAVTAGKSRVTYGELLAAAQAAAARFRASGCRHVVMIDTNSIAVPVAIFGAAYAGVPYVPLNYRLTVPELQELLGRLDGNFVIGSPEYLNKLDLSAAVAKVEREPFLKDVRGVALPERKEAPETTVAVRLFTSGTTGKPKSAVLNHENLLAYILGTVEFGSADENDSTLLAVPPYHIAGISAVLSSTYAGRRMVQMGNFDPAVWLQLCRDENVTNCFLVPTMLARVVDHLSDSGKKPDLPALRAIAYGGGRMPLAVIERAMKLLPNVDFTNAYGLTETSSTICILGPEDHRAAMDSDDPLVRKRMASVGKPTPAVEIEIRGESNEKLGIDEVGYVFVRGPQVSGQYEGIGNTLDNDGWFSTKDRGYMDAEGYVFLDGRADDVIVRGGENISPGEIEDVLLDHPSVSDVAVVSIPDDEWGEAVAAAVVLKSGANINEAELQGWVKERLRSTKVPKAIVFREQLPYNEMGKLMRRVIRQELRAD